jgi:hypothetical protein
MSLSTGEYPVDVRFRVDAPINRLWGIPYFGYLVRSLVLIPHLIVLFFLAIVAGIVGIFAWVPVLLMGRQAGPVYAIVGGYVRWTTRVTTYLYLMAGRYPPFMTGLDSNADVDVRIDEGQSINRLWGIPILGQLVRVILLIPHFIVLWILGIVTGFLIFFAWVPVLLLGHQAELVYMLAGGTIRWGTRVACYLLLLTDQYPPFTLSS